MRKPPNDTKYIYVLVFLFILIVAIKAYFALHFVNPGVVPDEVVYGNMAKNVLQGKLTSEVQYAQGYPPAYPILLSPADISTDAELVYHLMLLINCILGSSIIFPAYFILKKFIDKEEALYFSLVVSCLPSINVYFPLLMSENLFSPLFLFSAWFLLESISRKSFLLDVLSGFSVFLLFMTRTVGIVMIPGIVLAVFYKHKLSKGRNTYVLKTAAVMLLSFILPFIAWQYYKINNVVPQLSLNEFSDASGYDITAYMHLLTVALSTPPSFIKFVTLFTHEIDYMALVTYCAFLVFAAYSLCKLNSIKNKHDYSMFASYVSLSFILLLIITTTSMYAVSTTSHTRDVLGRYLDPVVAPIFIMGVVGFYQFRKSKERKRIPLTDSYMLAGLYVLTLLIFAFTFPGGVDFVQPHLLSVAYLSIVPSPSLFFALASIYLILYMLSMPKDPVFLKSLVVVLILVSLLITSFTALLFYPPANNAESYPIARYLQNHSTSTTLTLFDSQELDSAQSSVFYLTAFWSKTRLMLYPINNSKACPSIKADYLISNKTLSYPYENVTSDGVYNLYRINCD